MAQLRHGAISRNVAASITVCVIRIFHFLPAYVPGLDSACNRYGYMEYFLRR
jgi:hypothetical protein